MSIRPLCKELQLKSEAELNEDPKRVAEDIAYIKEWMKKAPHLNGRTDDQWILTFLRGCKFSLERTKEKLDMFYTMRTILPEFFKNRDPFNPQIQKILDMGLYLPLPKSKSPDSPRWILARVGPIDPTIEVEDMFKVNMMIIDIMIHEDDQIVIAGQSAFQDLTGITMTHMAKFSPSIMKKAMTCFLTAYPLRPKASHFVNLPSFFEAILALFTPFLTEKLKKRMNAHTGTNWDSLYEDIPKACLPKDYGGEVESVQELTNYWKKKVESYADWFKAEEQYGTDEKKRPGKPKTSDNVFGLEGSFRKLNVD